MSTIKTWKELLEQRIGDGQIITNDDVRLAMLDHIEALRERVACLEAYTESQKDAMRVTMNELTTVRQALKEAQKWEKLFFNERDKRRLEEDSHDALQAKLSAIEAQGPFGLVCGIREKGEFFGQLLQPMPEHKFHVFSAPVAPAQPLTKESDEAEEVLTAMDSCEWSVHRISPSVYLTDEANREIAWAVKREAAPYEDKEGNRQWTGPTAIAALRKGKEAIEIMKGVL